MSDAKERLRQKAQNEQTCIALNDLLKTKDARIGGLTSLCAELYQVLGSLDAPEHVLDKVSAAANGEAIPAIELLPFVPATPSEGGREVPETDQSIAADCYWHIADVIGTERNWSVQEHVEWMKELLQQASDYLHDIPESAVGGCDTAVELCRRLRLCLAGKAPGFLGDLPEYAKTAHQVGGDELCGICAGYGKYQDGDSGTESDGYAPNIVECDCDDSERLPQYRAALAPAAVVMPDRSNERGSDGELTYEAKAWNTCLDRFVEMNGDGK